MHTSRPQKALAMVVALLVAVALSQPQSGLADDAPASPISVDAEADKTELTVGDVVTFSVTVWADPDIQPSIPDFNGHFKGFDLIDNGVEGPRQTDEQMESVYWYKLRADLPGTYTIPPTPVTFTAPDPQNREETIQGQTLTPEVAIEIKSILHLQGEPTDIRDIKSILEIGGGWLRQIEIALLLLAVVGLAIWLWQKRKATPPANRAAPPPISLTPHELALRELQTLTSREWMEKGYFQEHYFELSEIFRRYLGGRFAFPALDWTLEEITRKMKELPEMNIELQQQARAILEYSDMVKFAKSTPSLGDSTQTMNSTLSFIQSTRQATKAETLQT